MLSLTYFFFQEPVWDLFALKQYCDSLQIAVTEFDPGKISRLYSPEERDFIPAVFSRPEGRSLFMYVQRDETYDGMLAGNNKLFFSKFHNLILCEPEGSAAIDKELLTTIRAIMAAADKDFANRGNNNNSLTRREIEIMRYLKEGKQYSEISEQLFLSLDTVRSHIRNIYRKLDVHTSIEAINRMENYWLVNSE